MTAAPSPAPSAAPLPGPADHAAATRRRRPFGLIAIIVMQLLTMLVSGLVLALLVFALAAASRMVDGEATADWGSIYLALSPGDIALFVLTFVVNGICAVGLWRWQRWAWFLTMLQLGFFMLSDLYSYFTNSSVATYGWSMLLNVAMVFYLNQRDVQAVFLTKDERRL